MESTKIEKTPEATVLGSYAYGWQQLWKHFLYFFVVVLIVGIAESPTSVAQKSEFGEDSGMLLLQMFAVAYAFLFLPVITYGACLLYLRGIRNEEMEIVTLFEGFKEKYISIILAHLITFTIIGIGFIFLIIPGIILACRLVFVPFLVMDKSMEPIAAIEKSWDMTRGHGWKIFGMGLLAILIFIGGLICFIVGAFIAFMWISAAFAAMFHALDLEDNRRLNNDMV